MESFEIDKASKGKSILAVARIASGWLMLWPFFDKLFGLGFQTPAGSGMIDGGSPSSFITYVSGGSFKDFFDSLAGNTFVDILLMAGLLILGLTLILGIASKLTTAAMTLFLFIMFLIHVPPTDNPIIDHRIIWILLIWAIYFLGGYDRLSLKKRWDDLGIVRKFPILE